MVSEPGRWYDNIIVKIECDREDVKFMLVEAIVLLVRPALGGERKHLSGTPAHPAMGHRALGSVCHLRAADGFTHP